MPEKALATGEGRVEAGAGLPVVAILGRPNAGKSTLFNRMAGGARAIVHSAPGVTRDRNVGIAEHGGRRLLLVDTGGFEDTGGSALAASVRAQAELAAESADAILLVVDGRAGVNPEDRTLMDRLRRLHKPVLCVVNKLDTPALASAACEFFSLGVSEVFALSAAHGTGVVRLFDRLLELLPEQGRGEAVPAEAVYLAIIGRPNVGKSSLLNRIVGYERAIVDAAPGTTRDALDIPVRIGDRDYVMVDTAGIRRRPRVRENVERIAVVRALRAIERADLAMLVIDATQEISDQDARIGSYAWERQRALVVVFNKWDAVPPQRRHEGEMLGELRRRYPSFVDVPGLAVSARTGECIERLFPVLEAVVRAHRCQLQTAEVNRALQEAVKAHPPPSVRGRQPRFYYAAQTRTAPPEITIFTSTRRPIPPAYERYLRKLFRQRFELSGTPLQLRFRLRPARQV